MSVTKQHKIMLYSHDSWGLGHLRRTLCIAHVLNRNLPNSSILIVSGSPCATLFPLNNGVDMIKLPSITKDSTGQYTAKQLRQGLGDVVTLRSALLESAFTNFRPDILIVDHQLIGMSAELLPILQRAKPMGAYCIYGMREVLDNPEATESAWANKHCQWALSEAFDEIWIYGDELQFNTVETYPTLSAIRNRIYYTGLVTNDQATEAKTVNKTPHVLVTVGGGEDGGKLILTYLHGLSKQNVHWQTTIVTGPMLPEFEIAKIKNIADALPNVELHKFHADIPRLLKTSDLVVSMAGYNSCAEIVDSRCPAILVPRTSPRQEQLIRARYLEKCGVATCLLDPDGEKLINSIESCLMKKDRDDIKYPSTTGLHIISSRVHAILENRKIALKQQLAAQLV